MHIIAKVNLVFIRQYKVFEQKFANSSKKPNSKLLVFFCN